jgi:hypothetical protein
MKRVELGDVFKLILKDKTKKEIKKQLGLKSNSLSNHLRKLEDFGCIERQGKFIIKVLQSSLKYPKVTKNRIISKLNKRGHAYNFKIIFSKEKNLLTKPKVRHELKVKNLKKLPFGSLKLTKDRNTIWINKQSLTIYSNNSYYAQDALHSKFRALKDIDTLVVYLKDRFNFKGPYGIEIFREHYGLIFNKFAKWILGQGKKMYVKNEKNKSILWVDDSRKDDRKLKEFEAGDPIKANTADKYFEEHEKTGWKLTPLFLMENLKEAKGNFKEIGEAIKESSKLQLDSELRFKQLENRLNGFEELFLQIIDKFTTGKG